VLFGGAKMRLKKEGERKGTRLLGSGVKKKKGKKGPRSTTRVINRFPLRAWVDAQKVEKKRESRVSKVNHGGNRNEARAGRGS